MYTAHVIETGDNQCWLIIADIYYSLVAYTSIYYVYSFNVLSRGHALICNTLSYFVMTLYAYGNIV